MIYSRWNTINGGYDYFEGPGDRPMGNDLPKVVLPNSSPIGVASVDAGRPMPKSAKYVGKGPVAKGAITPISRTALGMVQSIVTAPFLYMGLGIVAGWAIFTKRIKF